MANAAMNVAQIMERLAACSSRPRYAFQVLSLLAERAGPEGKVGPAVVDDDEERLSLRDYIGKRIARLASAGSRRRALETRVRAELAGQLPTDAKEAQALVDRIVDERCRSAGADNFSRVVSELERAGFVARYYQGYRTNHANRGGQRQLVCVLDGDVSAALRARDRFI